MVGLCIWEGELCVSRERSLEHFTYHYFKTFLFAHLYHVVTTTVCLKTLLSFTVMTCALKVSCMSSFYCNPFVLLLGPAVVVEVIPPALSTLRGVTASFTCNSEGFPLPNIAWMKQTGLGESEISASSANVQINSHNGSSQLIVKNTSTADSGYYTCKASNYVSDIGKAFLGVVSKLYLNAERAKLKSFVF